MGKRDLPAMENRGLYSERVYQNPREMAFAEQWEKENVDCQGTNYGFGILQDLFLETEGAGFLAKVKVRARITPRDRFIVATVIQWLGSNVGRGFLHGALRRFSFVMIEEARLKELREEAFAYRQMVQAAEREKKLAVKAEIENDMLPVKEAQ